MQAISSLHNCNAETLRLDPIFRQHLIFLEDLNVALIAGLQDWELELRAEVEVGMGVEVEAVRSRS